MKIVNPRKHYVKYICIAISLFGVIATVCTTFIGEYEASPATYIVYLVCAVFYPAWKSVETDVTHDNKIITNSTPERVIKATRVTYNGAPLSYYTRLKMVEGEEYADEVNGVLYLNKEHFNCKYK